jgi:hypothetical protein
VISAWWTPFISKDQVSTKPGQLHTDLDSRLFQVGLRLLPGQLGDKPGALGFHLGDPPLVRGRVLDSSHDVQQSANFAGESLHLLLVAGHPLVIDGNQRADRSRCTLDGCLAERDARLRGSGLYR